jgi:hypothetical protein
MLANEDPLFSQHVGTIATLMMTKFNEEFGTGEVNAVTLDHTVEDNRHHGKEHASKQLQLRPITWAMLVEDGTKGTITEVIIRFCWDGSLPNSSSNIMGVLRFFFDAIEELRFAFRSSSSSIMME